MEFKEQRWSIWGNPEGSQDFLFSRRNTTSEHREGNCDPVARATTTPSLPFRNTPRHPHHRSEAADSGSALVLLLSACYNLTSGCSWELAQGPTDLTRSCACGADPLDSQGERTGPTVLQSSRSLARLWILSGVPLFYLLPRSSAEIEAELMCPLPPCTPAMCSSLWAGTRLLGEKDLRA